MENKASLLLIKINPHIPTDFVIVDSYFCIHYFSIKDTEIYKITTFKEHKQRINDICFLKHTEDIFNTAFFSASSDGSIKLWDTKSIGSVNTIKCNIY